MAYRTLILLVLAVVIVALAVVSGIFAFTEGASKNRRDMVVARSIELASFTQEWRSTPGTFGGGDGSFKDVDIWKVTGQAATGDWLEENETMYRVDPHLVPDQALLVAADTELNYQVEMIFDGNVIISTEFVTGGNIYF